MRLFITVLLSASIVFCGGISRAQTLADTQYRPQLNTVRYSAAVPVAVKKAAQNRRTRFYGSFQQLGKKWAVHLYDTGPAQWQSDPAQAEFERSSRLDIFQLQQNRSWKRIQQLNFKRQLWKKKDPLQIEAQFGWLDPALQRVPLLYLEASEGLGYVLNSTVYAVLGQEYGLKGFLHFQNETPDGGGKFTTSELKFPDSSGNVTVERWNSFHGESAGSQTIYGWWGKAWKTVAHRDFNDGQDAKDQNQNLYWNGERFAPYTMPTKDPVKGTEPASTPPQRETASFPQLATIHRRQVVPASIKRFTKNRRPRFYGSFELGGQIYAIHLYDMGPMRRTSPKTLGSLRRKSQVEIFQFTGKTWRRTSSFAFERLTDIRTDGIRVEALYTTFNPVQKVPPLLKLDVATTNADGGYNFTTEVYGVLNGKPGAQSFFALQCYMPNIGLPVSSYLNFPDANGNWTVMASATEPSSGSYWAYGLTANGWKLLAESSSNFGDNHLYWNGRKFVPYEELPLKTDD